MSLLFWRNKNDSETRSVDGDHPLPVQLCPNEPDIPGLWTPNGMMAVPVAPSSLRPLGIDHRLNVAAVDKLALAGAPSLAAVTEAGSTLANTAYNVAVVAGNRWGPSGQAAVPTTAITPTASQAIRATIAQIAGADYYDIFLSVDTAPKWVGRISEAQRAAGGWIISTVGSPTLGGGAPAGQVDLGIVGTGQQTSALAFTTNNAYTPATPPPVICVGFSRMHAHVKLAVTDLRSAASLTIIPFFNDIGSTGDWYQGAARTLTILGAVGQCLLQDFEMDVDGANAVVWLVDAIAGQGAACTIRIELA
jgi:hypothetical protein